jgi:hypothetical protein
VSRTSTASLSRHDNVVITLRATKSVYARVTGHLKGLAWGPARAGRVTYHHPEPGESPGPRSGKERDRWRTSFEKKP